MTDQRQPAASAQAPAQAPARPKSSASASTTAPRSPELRPAVRAQSPAYEPGAFHTAVASPAPPAQVEIGQIHLRVAETDRARVEQLAREVGAGLLARIGELNLLSSHGRTSIDHLRVPASAAQGIHGTSSSASIVDEIIQALRSP